MSNLKELIDELCQDGVIHSALEEIAHYSAYRIPAADIDVDNYVSVENLLQNKMGKTTASSVPTSGNLIGFREGDILIGNIRPYLRKIWLADSDGGTNGDVLAIRINNREQISPAFLYYVLSSEAFFNYHNKNSNGAKMPRGDKKAVMDYIIPVPPLPVQAEIVRILDKLSSSVTELIALLNAELAARKKQYEYYKNKVFSSYQYENVRLDDVLLSIHTGLNPRKFFKLNTDDANNYYVTIREFKGGQLRFDEKTDRINDEAMKLCNNRSHLEIGDVLFSGTGTIGEMYVIEDEPSNWNIKEGVYALKPDQKKVLPRYLKYFLATEEMRDYFEVLSEGGTVKSISMKKMGELIIKLPSMQEQEKIVSMLDRFEALCNDLSRGIPAEIAARQKQYEYYRDKLLTFRPSEAR